MTLTFLIPGKHQARVLLCSGISSQSQMLARIHLLPHEVPGLPKQQEPPHQSVSTVDEYSTIPTFRGSCCLKQHTMCQLPSDCMGPKRLCLHSNYLLTSVATRCLPGTLMDLVTCLDRKLKFPLCCHRHGGNHANSLVEDQCSDTSTNPLATVGPCSCLSAARLCIVVPYKI